MIRIMMTASQISGFGNGTNQVRRIRKQNERLKKLALFVDENKEMIATGATVIAKNPELVQQYNNRQGSKHGVGLIWQ